MELLVVIGSIALLISILLPTLHKAREAEALPVMYTPSSLAQRHERPAAHREGNGWDVDNASIDYLGSGPA